LNRAFQRAARHNRDHIIDDDIDASAREISQRRLVDLCDEYKIVFPGIRELVATFENGPMAYSKRQVLERIEPVFSQTGLSLQAQQHFAILKSPQAVLKSLYSVGFLGKYDAGLRQYRFCHDGSITDADSDPDQQFLVHPCFSRALNCVEAESDTDSYHEIFDEHDITVTSQQAETRAAEIGAVLADLGKIPAGPKGASQFEDWCMRAMTIICAGRLRAFELKPNRNAVQRRDLVALNAADGGFWRRFREDYDTRHVVFEVKNYAELEADDMRQLASYLRDMYGRSGFIITRSRHDEPSKKELDWIREYFNGERKVLIILTERFVHRLVGKCRSATRFDYPEKQFENLLNCYERLYLSGGGPAKKKRKSSEMSVPGKLKGLLGK